MMLEPSKYALVGVDETPESQLALRWAVEAAESRGIGVRVVRAYLDQVSQWPAMGAEGFVPQTPVEQYQRELDAAVVFVRDRLGYDRGSGWLAHELAAGALLAESGEAELIVLGSKARNKLEAALLGSVATAVTAKAPCPVIVVRGNGSDGPILVAADGSADSEQAVEFAFEQAALTGKPVVAVYCWQPDDWHESVIEDTRKRLQGWLTEALAPYREKFPAVDAASKVMEGRPAATLAKLTEDASLLVVGSRGRGGVAGLLLGSVSQSLLHSARCPVAVVR